MADVTAVPGTSRIAGRNWSLRAERLETDEGFDHDWRALVGVRRGLNLLVTWIDQELTAEAWAGEPEDSDGVAVIDMGEGDVRLARVPLCTCGDRGCGNAGVQLSKWLAANELPALVALLRDLPWTGTIPGHENVLRGSGLAAQPGPENDYSPGGSPYLYAPGTGESFPLPSPGGGP